MPGGGVALASEHSPMGFHCAMGALVAGSAETVPPGTSAARPTEWVGSPRARKRAGLSIYSILLIMLLSVSVLSSIVVGIIGYANGTEALRAIAYEKLVEIRENRSREVAQLFTTIENSVRLGAMESSSSMKMMLGALACASSKISRRRSSLSP